MRSKKSSLATCILVGVLIGAVIPAAAPKAPARKSRKVLVISDVEGLDGVFDFDLQCIPFKSPLYRESRRVLAEEVNAAIKGLFEGGATSVVVYDNHYGGHNLSVLDIREEIPDTVRLLSGGPVSPMLGLDSSYNAIVFIGLHSMAGTPDGVLPHSFTWDIQDIWVNGKKVGEIGSRVMLGGELGIPAIMVSGDEAACKEFQDLVPNGKCATVKWGTSHTGGYSLPLSDALAEIKDTARDAMQRLSSFKPYPVTGPAEVKVEYKPGVKVPSFKPGPGVEQIDSRTWDFKGNDFISAWLKFRTF